MPIAARDQCLNRDVIFLERALLKHLLKKEGIAGELEALGEAAFQVCVDQGVFLCKEDDAVLVDGWHCGVGPKGEEDRLFLICVGIHQIGEVSWDVKLVFVCGQRLGAGTGKGVEVAEGEVTLNLGEDLGCGVGVGSASLQAEAALMFCEHFSLAQLD
jgi:hypothetical protein